VAQDIFHYNNNGAKRLRLPGVGHFAPVLRPEIFNAAVLDFLASVSPSHPIG
jgi:pimeloyl-ACP methyl ester carboxylesterase